MPPPKQKPQQKPKQKPFVAPRKSTGHVRHLERQRAGRTEEEQRCLLADEEGLRRVLLLQQHTPAYCSMLAAQMLVQYVQRGLALAAAQHRAQHLGQHIGRGLAFARTIERSMRGALLREESTARSLAQLPRGEEQARASHDAAGRRDWRLEMRAERQRLFGCGLKLPAHVWASAFSYLPTTVAEHRSGAMQVSCVCALFRSIAPPPDRRPLDRAAVRIQAVCRGWSVRRAFAGDDDDDDGGGGGFAYGYAPSDDDDYGHAWSDGPDDYSDDDGDDRGWGSLQDIDYYAWVDRGQRDERCTSPVHRHRHR